MTAGRESVDRLLAPPAALAPALALLAPLATTEGRRWFGRGLWLLLAIGILAGLLVGADRPARPHVVGRAALDATAGHSRPGRIPGFNQVGFRVVLAGEGGRGRPGCALLADTTARQQRGLMGMDDLAGYDAMVFRFAADTTIPFYDRGVPIDLSLAWFDSAGVYIGQALLARCTTACPLVSPNQPFRYAVEVPKGGLGRLGIGQGSALLVGGTCA